MVVDEPLVGRQCLLVLTQLVTALRPLEVSQRCLFLLAGTRRLARLDQTSQAVVLIGRALQGEAMPSLKFGSQLR